MANSRTEDQIFYDKKEKELLNALAKKMGYVDEDWWQRIYVR